MKRLVFAALILSGCSRSPAPPESAVTVRLSTENADANAPAVAAFFRRTCLDASADQGAFEQALQSSGWEVERTQIATSANPINRVSPALTPKCSCSACGALPWSRTMTPAIG